MKKNIILLTFSLLVICLTTSACSKDEDVIIIDETAEYQARNVGERNSLVLNAKSGIHIEEKVEWAFFEEESTGVQKGDFPNFYYPNGWEVEAKYTDKGLKVGFYDNGKLFGYNSEDKKEDHCRFLTEYNSNVYVIGTVNNKKDEKEREICDSILKKMSQSLVGTGKLVRREKIKH